MARGVKREKDSNKKKEKKRKKEKENYKKSVISYLLILPHFV